VPADRLKALRDAFAATMRDPQFIAEAQTAGMQINPVGHEEMAAIMARVYASPPALVDRVKAAMDLAPSK
jgi:hypothetical protein